jgi:hypothetical protein
LKMLLQGLLKPCHQQQVMCTRAEHSDSQTYGSSIAAAHQCHSHRACHC